MMKLLLLIFGGLKFGKVFVLVGMMFVLIVVYVLFYGWCFVVGFVVLLLVYEVGYYVVV